MKIKLLLLSLAVIFSLSCVAQSPFKPLPKPSHSAIKLSAVPNTMTAWRFTGPMGGYLYSKNGQQVVTGLGFGWNSLKYIDSTQNWRTTLSINGVIFAGGNVAPTLSPFTVMSAGVSVGFSVGAIPLAIGPVYNFSGSWGAFATIAVPLN